LVTTFGDGELLRLSSDGRRVKILRQDFDMPTGVALAPDGDIFVAEWLGNLFRVSPDGGRKTRIAQGLFNPDLIAVGPNGLIYVAEFGNFISEVDPQTGARRVIARLAGNPVGVAVDTITTPLLAQDPAFNLIVTADDSLLSINPDTGAVSRLAIISNGSGCMAVPAAPPPIVSVNETEPNDSPLTAQPVGDALPGQTFCIRGRVRMGDSGHVSRDLMKAGLDQPVQDWFVANLPEDRWGNGPVPVRIIADWPGQANVNVFAGTDVDASLISDGFKSLSNNRMATNQSPEAWPRFDETGQSVVFYLQPPGLAVEGRPFGRKLIVGVQHAGGPAADYTVSIETLLTFGSETHQIDDGLRLTPPNTEFGGQLVVNRYRPTGTPAFLHAIEYPFVQPDGRDPTGQMVRMVVFAGLTDDALAGPPANPAFLFDQLVAVPRTVSGLGEVVEINIVPPLRMDSGVLYVGFEFPDPGATGITAVFDAGPVQYLRTFASRDGGATWYRPTGTFDSFDAAGHRRRTKGAVVPGTVSMNANIRARFRVPR
jgi:hypothetical protein